MKSYLFNPENDLALAVGVSNYTPPKNAMLLGRCGSLLPLWYAEKGSYILADNADAQWIEKVKSNFGIDATVTATLPADVECSPWGWSPYAAAKFVAAGVNNSVLPDEAQLQRLRQLSHRRTTIDIVTKLKARLPFDVLKEPVEAKTIDDVSRCIERFGTVYFKSPWSSTGRGVASSSAMAADEVMRRCRGIISRQGSVMIEPEVDKKEDFAMLFYAERGKIVPVGFSLFKNEGNSYSDNLLLPDTEILAYLGKYVGEECIIGLNKHLREVLTEVIGDAYNGFFGVDMMIFCDDNGYHIDVCTELNLRMTMGVVAWLFRRDYLADGVSARFSVKYGGGCKLQTPPQIVSGRLVSGTQNLVPPGQLFSITVSVE